MNRQRYFKLIDKTGMCIGKYTGATPKDAAEKAFTEIVSQLIKDGMEINEPIIIRLRDWTSGQIYEFNCERKKIDTSYVMKIPNILTDENDIEEISVPANIFIRDIVNKVDIVYDPNPDDKCGLMATDNVLNIFENSSGIKELPWVIRLTLSKERMSKCNINITELKNSFLQNWSSRYENTKNKKIIDQITECIIASNGDNSPIPIVYIRFNANNYSVKTLIEFQEIIITQYQLRKIPDSNIHNEQNIQPQLSPSTTIGDIVEVMKSQNISKIRIDNDILHITYQL